MRVPFLFEFMDLAWLPKSLRLTLREALEYSLGQPPRRYYAWVIREIVRLVERDHIHTVIELGAGTAPIARRLARYRHRDRLEIEISDLYPDQDAFRQLERDFPGVVRAKYEAVDLSKPLNVRPRSLLVVSASFHHLHPPQQQCVLAALLPHRVAIFEPLRHHPVSTLVALFGFVPGLVAPLHYWKKRPGNFRRFFWSWFLPVAPMLIVWDGVVSSLRCWTEREWHGRFSAPAAGEPGTVSINVNHTLLCQMVSW